MSSYTFFALAAALVYLPLLATSFSIRPWRRRQKRLVWFLVAAILWSVADILRSTGIWGQYHAYVGVVATVLLLWSAAQFYYFVASALPPGKRAWLPTVYGSSAVISVLLVLEKVTGDITIGGTALSAWCGWGVIVMSIPVLALFLRSDHALWKRLGSTDSAMLYDQVACLFISVLVVTVTALSGVFLRDRYVPVGSAGYIVVALLLGYALTEHREVNVRPPMRRAVAWMGLGVVGAVSYWALFLASSALFGLDVDRAAILLATVVAVIVAVLVYNLRSFLPALTHRAFGGSRLDYFQRLGRITDKIEGTASLRQHGGQLLLLVNDAIGCSRSALLLLDANGTGFTTFFAEPQGTDNGLAGLRLESHTPIAELLERDHKVLTRESLAGLPEVRSVWSREIEGMESRGIELLVPLMGRDSLAGVLAIGTKRSGQYSVEDIVLLEHLADCLAVVLEKGYFREQHRQYEEELSVMNRSSMIITSTLDVESVYDSLIDELRKIVDISWAAVSLIDEQDTYFLAVSSPFRSGWKTGDRLPIRGTPAEWLAAHGRTVVEPDLEAGSRIPADRHLLRHGFRSAAHIPLATAEGIIGSLDLASRRADAFSARHIDILEQIASQIATQIENFRLYGEAVRMARIDELTGLLNRRAMNEMIGREIDRCSRYGGRFSVVVLDIDSLKSVNDSRGHLAGDEFLRNVGSTLRTAIRSTDQAFRYGGDEFAILLPQTALEAAAEVAERVRRQLAANAVGMDTPTTASLGVASWPASGVDGEALMAAADAALYQAKKDGGNQSRRAEETTAVGR